MTSPRRWWRSTIRVRLTLLYAGAFFLAGAVLVALMYFFMAQAFDRQMAGRVLITEENLQNLTAVESGSPRIVVGEVQAVLQTQFRQDRDATLNTMLITSLILLGVVGVIAGGFGWFLAGQALQPLQEITATARRVADRSLHERIGLTGPNDEIKDLADTFDAMLERLDRAFNSQRRFVANASHELRTPLAINRTLIEVALDNPGAGEPLRQLGTTLLAVNQRHERLIDGLLTKIPAAGNGMIQPGLWPLTNGTMPRSGRACQRSGCLNGDRVMAGRPPSFFTPPRLGHCAT